MEHEKIKVLDHGYLKFIESWGRGEVGEMEAAIIEAARQSTQGSFRGWDVWVCGECGRSFYENIKQHTAKGYGDEWCKGKLSNDEALLAFMFNHNHTTPFEFCGLTIEVQAPIMVFREWHRHRTQSYNEMSARYAPLPDLSYIPEIKRLFKDAGKNKQAQALQDAEILTQDRAINWQMKLVDFYQHAEEMYQYGLKIGIPKELARLCVPVGRYSRMRATGNLWNWLHFLTLRNSPHAQEEIRLFAQQVYLIIEQQFPRTAYLFREKSYKDNGIMTK